MSLVANFDEAGVSFDGEITQYLVTLIEDEDNPQQNDSGTAYEQPKSSQAKRLFTFLPCVAVDVQGVQDPQQISPRWHLLWRYF